jgi:cyd operon protein YbgT
MWYFTWILGVGLAIGFGILNGVWHEFHASDVLDTRHVAKPSGR